MAFRAWSSSIAVAIGAAMGSAKRLFVPAIAVLALTVNASWAATIAGPGTVTDLGTLIYGTPVNFSGSIRTDDGKGNGVSDSVFRFTIASSGKFSASVAANNPFDYQDFHMVLFNANPSSYPLYTPPDNPDPTNTSLIDLDTTDLGALGFLTGASGGSGGLLSFNLLLDPGIYFLRVFGLTNELSSGAIFNGQAQVDVSAVPLPAASLLFLSGLGGLGIAAWRRKRKGVVAAAA